MDATEFLKMLENREDKLRRDASRLLMSGETYRAAAAAGGEQACKELSREITFRLEAVERETIRVGEQLRKRIERKQARQAVRAAAKVRAA